MITADPSEPVQCNDAMEVYGRDPDDNLFSLFEPAPGSSRSIKMLEKGNW